MHYRRSFVVAMLMITVVPLLIGCASRVVNTYRGVVYVADESGDDRHVLLVARRNVDLWPLINSHKDGRFYVVPLSSIPDDLQELALSDRLQPSDMPSGARLRKLLRTGGARRVKGESNEEYRTPVGRATLRIPAEFEGATAWVISATPPTFVLGDDYSEMRSRRIPEDPSEVLFIVTNSGDPASWLSTQLVHEDDFEVKVFDLLVFNSSGRRIVSIEHFDEPRTLGSFFDVGSKREQVEN